MSLFLLLGAGQLLCQPGLLLQGVVVVAVASDAAAATECGSQEGGTAIQ
jgi:hypothetical protein